MQFAPLDGANRVSAMVGGVNIWAMVLPGGFRVEKTGDKYAAVTGKVPMNSVYLTAEPGMGAVYFRTEREARDVADALNAAIAGERVA